MQDEWKWGSFTISTDVNRLDLVLIHEFLNAESYWAKGRPFRIVEKAIRNSLNFGVYESGRQIGFARVVTDYSTFAWLADVFVLDEWRGRGLSKWLMQVISDHPELQGLRRWILATKDAHGLYAQFGFQPLQEPERFMMRFVDRPQS